MIDKSCSGDFLRVLLTEKPLRKVITMRKAQEVLTEIINGIETHIKECSKCKENKPLESFYKDKQRVTGYALRCKECEKAVAKTSREKNAEKHADRYRKWASENTEHLRGYQRDKRRANPLQESIYKQKRRAKMRNVEATLTQEQVTEILEKFNNKCALTDSTDVSLDHFIPIASGFGAHASYNIIPLDKKLNTSKNDFNPFEWFAKNKKRFSLEQSRFDSVIEYLSEVNGMSVEDYTDYVNGCFEYTTAI